MNWHNLISSRRLGKEDRDKHPAEQRTEFQRDYDRLIFSSPFRRMQNKTQVFPLPGSIFVHNRLTHSLEVSSVGRSLGADVARALEGHHDAADTAALESISAIVSAACLAHDMGNPPFGHSGEEAICSFFSEGAGQPYREFLPESTWNDITHFDGNANTLRLLTHRFNGRRKGGFVMTYSTLASVVKYPFSAALAGNKPKMGFFTPERLKTAYENCAAVAHQRIYLSKEVVDIELSGFHIIYTLLELMCEAVISPEKKYSQLLLKQVSSQYELQSDDLSTRFMAVLDYLSGMTDVFALDLYRKINGQQLPMV